jgi:imidazolonepropionase
MSTRVISNIGELTTNDPTLGDQSLMGRLSDAAIVLDEQRVLWVGPSREAPDADDYLDARGRAVVPGFVDSHTHLVFAGERSREFEARMAGERYGGGGIALTVNATRAASTSQLREATSRRARELRASGVTTMEIKSGYELNVSGEARLVELAAEFTDEVTFLGAHVVPEEFAHDRDAYVELVAGEMLGSCKDHARWADVFCDRGAFSVDESREVLLAARGAGLELRLHGNQLGETGGIRLAIELDAASVDHCTFVSDSDIALLAGSPTVATLLPGADFCTRSRYPSARRMLDAGVTVAIATDCNPGSSYVTSMGFIIALAVREMAMTPDEALWAATLGGARALRRADIGRLGPGARADLLILDAPRAAHLAYRPGSSLVAETLRAAR